MFLKTSSFQGNGAAAPFLSFRRDQWVRICLQPTDEVAIVLVDQCEATIVVKAQISQEQPSSQPVPRAELAALVDTFIGQIESRNRLFSKVVDDVQLGAGLVGVSRWKRLKEPTQSEDGCIGDECFAELVELWSDSVGNRDLLERMREEVAQKITKLRGKAVVETGASDGLVRC